MFSVLGEPWEEAISVEAAVLASFAAGNREADDEDDCKFDSCALNTLQKRDRMTSTESRDAPAGLVDVAREECGILDSPYSNACRSRRRMELTVPRYW